MVGKTAMAKGWRIYPRGEVKPVKVKILIDTIEMSDHSENKLINRRSEVWSGEMEILPKGEYLTKISIIAEGFNEPICEVPFSPMTGYYQWIPPLVDSEELEEIEETIIENTKEL